MVAQLAELAFALRCMDCDCTCGIALHCITLYFVVLHYIEFALHASSLNIYIYIYVYIYTYIYIYGCLFFLLSRGMCHYVPLCRPVPEILLQPVPETFAPTCAGTVPALCRALCRFFYIILCRMK